MVMGVPSTASMDLPTPRDISMVFVKQYYTLLNEAPNHVHRFYSQDSSFVHGGLERGKRSETKTAQGQKEINDRIEKLNFRDARTKIKQVDAHPTLAGGVVIQVSGQLSNNGAAMRPFMQTFVLAPQTTHNYYVYNDIFRYQDDLFSDDEDAGDGAAEADDEAEPESPPTPAQTQPVAPAVATPPSAAAAPVSAPAQPPAPAAAAAPDSSFAAASPPQMNGHVASPPQPQQPEPTVDSPAVSPPPPAAASLLEPDAASDDLAAASAAAPTDAAAASPPQQARPASPAPAPARQPSPAPPPPPAEPKTYANLLKNASRPAPRPAAPATAPVAAAAAPVAVDKEAVVRPAAPRPAPPPRAGAGAGEPSDSGSVCGDLADRRRRDVIHPDSHQIFVGNLPQDITGDELVQHFKTCGTVVDVKIHNSKPPMKGGAGPRPYPLYGFVVFDSIVAAQDARNDKSLLRLRRPQDEVEHRLNIEEKKMRPGEGRGRVDRPGVGGRGPYGGGRGMPRGRGGYGRGELGGGRGVRGGYDGRGGMRR